MAMGQDDSVDTIGIFAQVGEVRKYEVNTGHVSLGKHDANVNDDQASFNL